MNQTTSLESMVRASVRQADLDVTTIAEAVAATLECMAICTMCADDCTAESSVDPLRRCIRLNIDCADLCGVAAKLLCRTGSPDLSSLRAALEACIHICVACATECEQHLHHEHCKLCAETCRTCARACRAALDVLTEGPSS